MKGIKYNEDKEPVFLDDTSSVEMEEDEIDRKDESKKYMMREKSISALMTLPLMKYRKV